MYRSFWMAFSFEEHILLTLLRARRSRHRSCIPEPAQRSRDREGPPRISEGPCAKPLLSLTTSYTSKVAMKRQCRKEVPHFTAVMANLGWKMLFVYASRLWCSVAPRSPALLKRVFPKAVADFSQASLCTGQDCWQLNIQLQNIIFRHFDLCSSVPAESHMKKKKPRRSLS